MKDSTCSRTSSGNEVLGGYGVVLMVLGGSSDIFLLGFDSSSPTSTAPRTTHRPPHALAPPTPGRLSSLWTIAIRPFMAHQYYLVMREFLMIKFLKWFRSEDAYAVEEMNEVRVLKTTFFWRIIFTCVLLNTSSGRRCNIGIFVWITIIIYMYVSTRLVVNVVEERLL